MCCIYFNTMRPRDKGFGWQTQQCALKYPITQQTTSTDRQDDESLYLLSGVKKGKNCLVWLFV